MKKVNDLTVTKAFEYLQDDKERLFVEYFATEGDYEKAAKLAARQLAKMPGTFIRENDWSIIKNQMMLSKNVKKACEHLREARNRGLKNQITKIAENHLEVQIEQAFDNTMYIKRVQGQLEIAEDRRDSFLGIDDELYFKWDNVVNKKYELLRMLQEGSRKNAESINEMMRSSQEKATTNIATLNINMTDNANKDMNPEDIIENQVQEMVELEE